MDSSLITKNQWTFSSNAENFERVFNWYSTLPRIFRSFTIFKDCEKDEFIASLKAGRNYEGYEDNELKCFIHGEIKDKMSIEGHLFCEPYLSIDLISSMVNFAKYQAFNEFPFVVTQVIKRHPMLHEVMRRTGFLDTGLRSYSHRYRGNLLEVVHYVAKRP